MPELKGSCRCGKVQFSTSADPIFAGICHCTKCQQATGTAFATVVAIPTPALTVTGNTTQFDDVGDTGNATHRRFCPVCGTSVAMTADIMQGVTMVPFGTLKDQSAVTPNMQIYCDSAQPWAKIPDMQGFGKMPPPPG
jgi:hypothetical protein